jgi:hypothetical protein
MKLKSFGCSFIFGSELADNPTSKLLDDPVNQFSLSTWPALFAKQLEYDYVCHARPGAGNLQIAERVMNECSADDSNFFIINWTFIDRFDYSGPVDEWQPWSTVRPGSTEKWAEVYWKNLHSEYRDKLTTLIYIKTVIDLLIEKDIKFIMTYMDDLMFDQRWHITPAVKTLQESILPYMTTFDGKNFLDWSRSNGYPETEAWHPLEEAHAAAADYMLKLLVDKV